jgi:hypothetical protein
MDLGSETCWQQVGDVVAKPVEPRPTGEVKLDRWIRKELGQGPEDYTPENWCSLREQMRLIALYTGKCVAFRDHYKLDSDGRQYLARREVLRASRSMKVIFRYVDTFPEDVQRDVWTMYIERPEELLEDLGCRVC